MKERTVGALAVVFALSTVLVANAQDAGPRLFPTPEAAVEALVGALRDNDEAQLVAIVGEPHRDLVVHTDQAAAREYRRRLYEAAQVSRTLQQHGDDRVLLVIGGKAWPFPIPLVRAASGWHFDADAGAEEIINRRIGSFELNAIEVCRAYMEAQRQYASKDRDGDGVLEYAQQIASTPGRQDGLYWDAGVASDREVSPFGSLIAEAQPFRKGAKPGDPYQGYFFRILTAQGPNAPGGRHRYVINGNMIAGFAMVAYPADYGVSGVMTFVCSHHRTVIPGAVFQKDLGERTAEIGRAMKEYDPDPSWTLVDEEAGAEGAKTAGPR